MSKKIITSKILHIISLLPFIISFVFFLYFYISMFIQTGDNAEVGNAILLIIFLYYGSICNAVALLFNIISFFLISKKDIEVNSSLTKTKKKFNLYNINSNFSNFRNCFIIVLSLKKVILFDKITKI